MKKCYLGIDVGSISTKGVIIDNDDKIIASEYLYTKGNSVAAVKKLISILGKKIKKDEYQVVSVGTTGSARKLIGTILGASVIKNEIIAHAIGTTSIYPEVRTIFEIGGHDSKIILLEQGIVVDYEINTLYAEEFDSFLTSFSEFDLICKVKTRCKSEDIIARKCKSIAFNYLNNVGNGKEILGPIVFQGGVSKNIGVVKAFEALTGEKIIVDSNSHLMGALGVAILARKSKKEQNFNFDIINVELFV